MMSMKQAQKILLDIIMIDVNEIIFPESQRAICLNKKDVVRRQQSNPNSNDRGIDLHLGLSGAPKKLNIKLARKEDRRRRNQTINNQTMKIDRGTYHGGDALLLPR